MSKRKRRQKRDDKFHDPSAECLQCLAESASGCLSPGKLMVSDAFYDSPCDPAQDGCESKLQSGNLSAGFMDNAHFDGLANRIEAPMSYNMLPLSPDSILFSPGASSGLQVEEKWSPNQPLSPISEISKVLESLEAQAQSGSRSLDEILHVNKACITSIARIWATEEYAKYRCCDMLTASALDLIMTLFEEALLPLQAGNTSEMRCEGLPDVHFGVFEVDSEEQVAMAKRLVVKELMGCLRIIRERFKGDPDCKSLVVQCGSVLDRRVESLISSLES
ncbi:hypothetical protein ACJZ2D_003044 [Fusarium nematophilum]